MAHSHQPQADLDSIAVAYYGALTQLLARSAHSWRQLVRGVAPKATDCGPVYELANPLPEFPASLAIADMTGLAITGPHYHRNETEIYLYLAGRGVVVVGNQPHQLSGLVDTTAITPPDTAHYTCSRGLVVAVVNVPRFDPSNYVALDPGQSNDAVNFDTELHHRYHRRTRPS